jgi:hypothetical protein
LESAAFNLVRSGENITTAVFIVPSGKFMVGLGNNLYIKFGTGGMLLEGGGAL